MSLRPTALLVERADRVGDLMAYAKALTLARGDALQAAAMLESRPNVSGRVLSIAKSAAQAGSMGGSTWGEQLAEFKGLTAALFEILIGISAFDTLLAGGMKRVPFRSRVVIATAAASGSIINETQIKPVSSLSLDGDTTSELKAVAILAATSDCCGSATVLPISCSILNCETRSASQLIVSSFPF